MDGWLGALNTLAQSPFALAMVLMVGVVYLWRLVHWLLQKDETRWGIVATVLDLLKEDRYEHHHEHKDR